MAAEELTLARVAHYPLPGGNTPVSVRFSPDNRLLSYLWSGDGSLVRQLWCFDLQTKKTRLLMRPPGQGDTDSTVSAEEALRRERLRMRGFGITSYEWADKQPVLLVPLQGRLYVSDDLGEHLRELAIDGEAIDPHLSPNGDAVAYVQDGELWRIGTAADANAKRLTHDASTPLASGERLVMNGLAEFIAQEEMGRASGFWWSKDGTKLAFAQVDSGDIPLFAIPHDTEDPPSVETHRYPFAGARNARVRLGVVDANGSSVQWIPTGEDDDVYLARVDWAPDGSVFYQVESRDQRRLDLNRFDPASGITRLVLTETSDTWINLHNDLRFIDDAGSDAGYRILWSSERVGFRHFYTYSQDGTLLDQLTDGPWLVDRIVDVNGGLVYFLAGKESPLERHIYRVPADGGKIEALTSEPGMHTGVLSPSGELIADQWDSRRSAPRLDLISSDGRRLSAVYESEDREADRLGLRPPEIVTASAADGTLLYGALYRSALEPGEPSPLVVSVYGGPHVQQVSESWGLTVDLRAQYLTRQGYCVLKLDNRGSARRGHAFEAAIMHDLGNLEVQDQVAGVRAASKLAGVDGSRVGVYGWSYGGYMAAMCLLRAPEVFRAGVAGAPVIDWDGYDTHYTERYMGTPAANPEGYRTSSALEHARNLQGSLMLIHGMIDENVHYRHTVRLVDALIAAGKDFRLLPFPHERHMPRREEDRAFMERQIVEHFQKNL